MQETEAAIKNSFGKMKLDFAAAISTYCFFQQNMEA